ncbi:hypothetical protein PV326_000670, partial [Microctonus aethiopoides]
MSTGRIYDRVVPRCDDRGSLRGSFTIVSQSSGIQSEWEDVQCVLDDSSGADDAAACLINLLVAIVGFASSKSACSRGSKKSVLFYTTDCGDEKEDIGLNVQQRSVSL